MYSWKDKIADKLSLLLSGSPSSTSPTFNQPQARPYSTDGKSLSSIFSFFLPSTGNGLRSNKDQHDIKSIKSLGNSAEYDDEYEQETPHRHEDDGRYFSLRVTKYENMGISNSREEYYEDLGSARSTAGSEMFVDAIDRHSLEKSMPHLTDNSLFISYDLYEFFESALPNIVKGCQWVLLYSTKRHGISLRTLIRKSADLSGPCLLITGDKQGAVFGGLLDCPLKPTAKRKYQGTNQSFVFTTLYGEPRLFRPTGANRYFYMCLNDLLALGGGGNFALCMDGDLLTGSSGASDTFGNLCLAHNQEFELKNVENHISSPHFPFWISDT